MSGIVGLYFRDGRPIERVDLSRMVDTLAHRGPDGAGVWHKGPVGLGHRMLWTTPESLREHLPLANRTNDLVITADARIDNRDELIATLRITNRPSREITDSELILSAYERWSDRCPEKILGDFAFAIWDDRKQTLFCARDHFGVKPFYYYCSQNLVVFASELKALFAIPEVPRQLNELQIAYYVAGCYEDKIGTFYDGIVRLPPAHTLSATRQGVALRCYWNLDASQELKLRSDHEYAEAFREVFTEAVRCRLPSAFPVGSTLSGGLDSSSIACTARNLLAAKGEQLHTFSAIFPSLADTFPKIDERRWMDAVVATGGFTPHYIHADRYTALRALSRYEDEPLTAVNMYLDGGIADQAREQGIRVMFHGHDGDTVVSHGFEYLPELARTGRWRTLVREIQALVGTPASPSHLRIRSRVLNLLPSTVQHAVRLRRRIWQFGFAPLIPEPAAEMWRRLGGRDQPGWATKRLVHPDFARRVDLGERIRVLERPTDQARTPRELQAAWITSGVNVLGFEVYSTVFGARGIEPRFPFYDRRVVELCVAMPYSQRLQSGWSRSILRRAMAGILPAEVQRRRSKQDIGPNYRKGMLGEEREAVEDVIIRESEIIDRYVSVPALRQAYQRLVSEGPSCSDQDSYNIFLVVNLALWLRKANMRGCWRLGYSKPLMSIA